MMSWNFARALGRQFFGRSGHRRPHVRTPYRPELLGFEDRVLPAATLTWVGTGAGNGANWSVATNWNPAQLPGGTDTLIFDRRVQNTSSTMDLGGGATYHIGKLRLINGYEGTITLANHLYTDVLEMNSGIITTTTNKKLVIWQRTTNPGIGVATIFETSYWRGGTISAPIEIWVVAQQYCQPRFCLGF
jgi:hypothetical protein